MSRACDALSRLGEDGCACRGELLEERRGVHRWRQCGDLLPKTLGTCAMRRVVQDLGEGGSDVYCAAVLLQEGLPSTELFEPQGVGLVVGCSDWD